MRAVALILDELSIEEEARQHRKKVEDRTEEMECKYATMVDTVVMTMDQMLAETEKKLKEVCISMQEAVQTTFHRTDSYAAVAATNWQAHHGKVQSLTSEQAFLLEKEDAKAKQVLVDAADGGIGLSKLTEEEIVLKAMLAIKGMETKDKERIVIVGAKKLRNGGIILKAKNREGAELLKEVSTKEDFALNFGGEIKIKDRNHTVIVKHVPISFQADIMAELQKAEEANNLVKYSILSTRWIKPLHRRSPGQKVAHLIINAATMQCANSMIRSGIILVGKRTFGRKLIQEPR